MGLSFSIATSSVPNKSTDPYPSSSNEKKSKVSFFSPNENMALKPLILDFLTFDKKIFKYKSVCREWNLIINKLCFYLNYTDVANQVFKRYRQTFHVPPPLSTRHAYEDRFRPPSNEYAHWHNYFMDHAPAVVKSDWPNAKSMSFVERPKLKQLKRSTDISEDRPIEIENVTIILTALSAHKVTSLRFREVPITDDCLTSIIVRFPKLTSLTCGRGAKVTLRGLGCLSQLPDFRALALHSLPSFESKQLNAIFSLVNLTSLDLSQGPWRHYQSSHYVSTFEKRPDLAPTFFRNIHLFPMLASLRIGNRKFLEHLSSAKSPSLVYLEIKDAILTDDLLFLMGMKSLKHLKVGSILPRTLIPGRINQAPATVFYGRRGLYFTLSTYETEDAKWERFKSRVHQLLENTQLTTLQFSKNSSEFEKLKSREEIKRYLTTSPGCMIL